MKTIVRNNHPRLYNFAGMILKPGVNEVDSATWAKVKEIKAVKTLIGDHIIEEVVGELRTIEEKSAIKIVGETLDIDQLKAWIADENIVKRAKVARAIRDQITKLEKLATQAAEEAAKEAEKKDA